MPREEDNEAVTKDTYSIILPTYNERENLPIIVWLLVKTLSEFFEGDDVFEIIIVDDNSPDGTQDVAKELQRVYGADTIILAPRPGKLGLGTSKMSSFFISLVVGSAYVHGMSFAKGNWIIIMDSDFSHHPRFIPEMIRVQRATQADIVKGNRYISGGGVYGWPLERKLTSCIANFIAETVMASRFGDLTGSFRLYRRSVFVDLVRSTVTKGYTFQIEILVRAQANNKRIFEIPITFVDRQFGESKLGVGEIAGFLRGLWMLLWSDLMIKPPKSDTPKLTLNPSSDKDATSNKKEATEQEAAGIPVN